MAAPEADPLHEYEVALGSIHDETQPVGVYKVLAILVSRDAVARFLNKQDVGSTADIQRLIELDRRFREHANRLAGAVSPRTLEEWRSSALASDQAWWWRLHDVTLEDAAGRQPWWPLLTAVLLAACLGSTNLLFRRIFPGGALSTVSQGFVTIAAGSTLTKPGRRWIDQFLLRAGKPRSSHYRWYALLAAVALAVSLVPWLGLSIAARQYNNYGARLARAGAGLSRRAEASFRTAISLDPAYGAAHYNLAGTLEDEREFDAAIGEYETTISLDPDFFYAYNNLARLYITANKPENALRVLDSVLTPANSAALDRDPRLTSSLLKNHGWASLKTKNYRTAESDLTRALNKAPGAGAYCLLAQVREDQGQKPGTAWEDCLRNQNQTRDAEPELLMRASERVRAQ